MNRMLRSMQINQRKKVNQVHRNIMYRIVHQRWQGRLRVGNVKVGVHVQFCQVGGKFNFWKNCGEDSSYYRIQEIVARLWPMERWDIRV